jgi:glutamine amidotransferase
MQSVAVIDYGASNLRSVIKAIEHESEGKFNIIVTDKADQILGADRIIFPGQGAIRQCMNSLQEKNLDKVLIECLKSKPYLGLCLGLQALMESSEEDGGVDGLGIIPGKVIHFPKGQSDDNGDNYKIPHMGWNNVEQSHDHPLWKNISSGEMFYFVHSYYVQPELIVDTSGTTNYAVCFTSAIARDNIFAVQFHPEKSQRAGMQLLSNFLNWE